jgi:hypothetical protein
VTAIVPARRTAAWLNAVAIIISSAAGCSRPGQTNLYEVAGRATFAGRAIPAGRIVFEPDTARGAGGMVSIADIRAGFYRTRPGRGFGGGPCVVTIYGSDGTMPTEEHDTALFPPWRTMLDLPQADCNHDFTVPPTR